ncbi:hypothetical protein PTSG_07914 [Salpingoeca rosetta]|uniref:Beta-1,4-glucuronyltransferase 1 n=1 Tax=Salpingoeca rosetta (strain ATCC 50818 / BSB-021) TaxID=946362 RepID=F2UGP5_SALR5|nr:uncharacterized protein PTSG_07914 [Salpingoeca rosetta]EGD75795.1 hypothetical protein PTSG_07914 [Salpingoeca rosetta]|eukprot:XP_004991716.1 hypothetical protein PTSG_07914 [Salpingoeca rosetta]
MMSGGGAVTGVLLLVLVVQYAGVWVLTWEQGDSRDHHGSHQQQQHQHDNAHSRQHGGRDSLDARTDLRRRLLISDVHVGSLFAAAIDGDGIAALIENAVEHGEYLVLPNVIKSTSFVDGGGVAGELAASSVTICTHASLDNVKAARHQAHAFRAQGAVSIAVFVNQDVALALATLARLALCADFSNVDAHVVLDRGALHTYAFDLDAAVNTLTMDCEQLFTGRDQPMENYGKHLPYPNNALRNIARQYATSKFITVLDVDIVPSASLVRAFSDAAAQLDPAEISNTAFVLPAFEISAELPVHEFPTTREEMLATLAAGTAQPFYKDVCWKCQKQTRYDIWEATPSDLTYEVPWTDPWEPFYIAKASTCPPYDERFKQYGFNRISQVCETHIAGFKFKVLYDAFVMHAGFKVPTAFHPTKQEELSSNRMLFRQFKQELKSKYPGVARRCY